MGYDEGWNGKHIHRLWGEPDPPPGSRTVQQREHDDRPVLWVLRDGKLVALYQDRRAGFTKG